MPVGSVRQHSLRNWHSQLATSYSGPVEFIFVVDSCDAPAHGALQQLLAGAKVSDHVRLLVAGPAATCSQKIHNLLVGVRAASPASQYVLCLDDDVALHPGALTQLVAAMEADTRAFMATGYPFDIPPPGAGLLCYAALSYHLPLLIAFSIAQRTAFVWGGCMLFRAAPLRSDCYGILQAWAEGGYSDDLTVAAKCGDHSLRILCPSSSIYPQWLEGGLGWAAYWNYLRRQLYVMDTYASPAGARTGHAMMVLHSYISWGVVLPAAAAAARLATWLAEVAILPTQQVWDGPGTSLQWLALFGVAKCPLASAAYLAFIMAFLAAAAALRWMTGIVVALLAQQAPRAGVPPAEQFQWGRLWAGFVLNNALLPVCMAVTALRPDVTWAGVRYFRQRGRIVRVERRSSGR